MIKQRWGGGREKTTNKKRTEGGGKRRKETADLACADWSRGTPESGVNKQWLTPESGVERKSDGHVDVRGKAAVH